MEYLSLGIVYIMELMITVSFADRLMKKKLKTPLIYFCGLPAFAIGYGIYFAFESLIINTIVSFIIFMFIMLIGYEDKLINKVLYSIYLNILGWVSESILLIPVFKTYSIIVSATTNQASMMFVSIMIKLLHFILSQLLVIIIKPRAINKNKKYLPLFAYPIFTTCIFFVLVELFNEYKVSMNYYWALLVFSIIVAFSSIMIFSYYQHLEETDLKIKELEKEKQFIELNDSYMQVLEHQNNDMHMIVHDVKNHYATIASMDSVKEIHKYVEGISDDVQRYQVIRLTDNKMLDLLLSKYKVECNSKNINFNIEVKTANLDSIDDSDLSILVCNLLDNAIESAQNSNDKLIAFSLRKVNFFEVLTITNSCDSEPNINGKRIITSKADKTSHGYGMKIISKYAKKNNAEYEWHYDNDSNTFNSTLIFKK